MPSYDFVVSTGVILVDTDNTLSQVQDEYKLSFNNTDIVVDSGPLSVLIEAETESRNGISTNNAQLANQINPNQAGGVYLDDLYALFGGERKKGERTLVVATLNGTPGLLIPAGSTAQSDEGDIYVSTGDATLDGLGTTTQNFQAQDIGILLLSANSLTQIVLGPIGWTNIDNLSPGVTGSEVESDPSARNERIELIGLQSLGVAEAVIAAIKSISDVRSLIFRQNDLTIPQNVDGFLMVRNSILTVVDGGTDLEVATALSQSKTGGAAYNGSTNVIVINPASLQPLTVLLERPAQVQIFATVTISPSSSLTDPTSLTKEAVVAYANGNIDGYLGFVVGIAVNPFDMSNGINDFNASINATRVEVGLTAVVSADNIPITIQQVPIISEAFVTVIVV